MKMISDYLDDAAKITNSDYKTAPLINLSRAQISNARKTGRLGENSCVKLAGLLDVDPAEVIRASNLAKHPENAKIWKKWAAVASIMAVMVTGNIFFNSESYAANLTEHSIHYAQYEISQKSTGVSLIAPLRVYVTKSALPGRHKIFCKRLAP